VTKKVGHSPERNRIKRRLRSAVQAAAADYAAARVDVVVIGRRDILTAAYATLVEDLRRALAVVAKPKGARPVKKSEPSPSHTVGAREGPSHG
jgi:ribonuclease P protein component